MQNDKSKFFVTILRKITKSWSKLSDNSRTPWGVISHRLGFIVQASGRKDTPSSLHELSPQGHCMWQRQYQQNRCRRRRTKAICTDNLNTDGIGRWSALLMFFVGSKSAFHDDIHTHHLDLIQEGLCMINLRARVITVWGLGICSNVKLKITDDYLTIVAAAAVITRLSCVACAFSKAPFLRRFL